MGEVINLRQARKAKARSEDEQKAAGNRLQFGRRKEDKELLRQLDELREKNLDGHKRED
ncbi:MAG: DUF4169 family protein [Aestuariivirga sp.]